MELERTLIYNQRMVNEGVHNLEYPLEGIYGDATIINQPSYQNNGQDTTIQINALLVFEDNARKEAIRQENLEVRTRQYE